MIHTFSSTNGSHLKGGTAVFVSLHLYASRPHSSDEGDGDEVPGKRHQSHQAVLRGFVFEVFHAAEHRLQDVILVLSMHAYDIVCTSIAGIE